MRKLRIHKVKRDVFAVVFGTLTATTVLASSPATASTAGSSALLYDYNFIGTTGTVANSAPGGPVAPLTLSGTWKGVPGGVHFSGNTTGNASVASGRPASGYTLNEPATAAVGVGTRIVYQAPAAGTCNASTPNITQIGLYSARAVSSQVKLQESGCAVSTTETMIECRFAGSKTAPGAAPVISTLALVNGDAYDIACVKSPDKSNGTAAITLTVTRIKGDVKAAGTFNVPAVGAVQTKRFISAGNKFPLAPAAQNTDQFNGTMASAAYCAGTVTAVNSCLSAYLPA
jgi:hypothetical protein